jgi:hypothetical protein
VIQGYPGYRLSWQAYDFCQGGYGGPQMFPLQQFTGCGPSSPGAPRVTTAPPRINPEIRPSSSASSAPGQLPGAPGRPPLASQWNNFSWQRNRAGQMLPGLPIYPHCQRVPMSKMMQSIRAMIRRTWAQPQAKPQSA